MSTTTDCLSKQPNLEANRTNDLHDQQRMQAHVIVIALTDYQSKCSDISNEISTINLVFMEHDLRGKAQRTDLT